MRSNPKYYKARYCIMRELQKRGHSELTALRMATKILKARRTPKEACP